MLKEHADSRLARDAAARLTPVVTAQREKLKEEMFGAPLCAPTRWALHAGFIRDGGILSTPCVEGARPRFNGLPVFVCDCKPLH